MAPAVVEQQLCKYLLAYYLLAYSQVVHADVLQTTYLSAYSVFLSSIAGVMISDYYIVRKGYLQTRDLYSARKDGPYYFTFGVHWRAYVA